MTRRSIQRNCEPEEHQESSDERNMLLSVLPAMEAWLPEGAIVEDYENALRHC